VPEKRAAVALSGGVDSAVAAALLKEQGWRVTAFTLRLWALPDDNSPDRAVEAARRVADALELPFEVVDLCDMFRPLVLDYYQQEYGRGRTPIPCIFCNRDLKFGELLVRALGRGSEVFATGHYARLRNDDGVFHLLRGTDPAKDQSYMLARLDQRRLARVVFPLGELTKTQVREIARERGLSFAADIEESQDLCFQPLIGAGLLRPPGGPGDIVDGAGMVIGRHAGLGNYTVGQRHGLPAAGERIYVTALDPASNRVVAGPEEALWRRRLLADDLHWISGTAPNRPFEAEVRIRYRSPGARASVVPKGAAVEVTFAEPQRAPTAGQAAVFYTGDEVTGCGTIEETYII
jgi:tRNA-specific 2-thiouridylase